MNANHRRRHHKRCPLPFYCLALYLNKSVKMTNPSLAVKTPPTWKLRDRPVEAKLRRGSSGAHLLPERHAPLAGVLGRVSAFRTPHHGVERIRAASHKPSNLQSPAKGAHMAAITMLLTISLIAAAHCAKGAVLLMGRAVRRLITIVRQKARALQRGEVLPTARVIRAPTPKSLPAP